MKSRRVRSGVGVGLLAALCALAAGAHIVYGTKTLRDLVAEADLVLHARITAVDVPVGLTTERGRMSRPTVQARVLETLKGDAPGETVRFAQHGHGVAPFREGDETLLFLLPIAKSRELRALGETGLLAWVSLQEHEDVYPVRAETRGVLLPAVRDYVAATGADPDARSRALRRATLALLTSRDADLAASALRDLALAPRAPLIVREDLPVLLPVLDDGSVSMGVRAALLTELARRGLVEPEPHWAELLSDEVPPRDRVTAIRAAAASAGPAMHPRLVALLGDADAQVAAAAANALGRPGDAAAVAPLVGVLAHPASRVRMAAVRGLGRVATPEALAALRRAAEGHEDDATRRRARAELLLREPAATD